jgi:hypothetical protein
MLRREMGVGLRRTVVNMDVRMVNEDMLRKECAGVDRDRMIIRMEGGGGGFFREGWRSEYDVRGILIRGKGRENMREEEW